MSERKPVSDAEITGAMFPGAGRVDQHLERQAEADSVTGGHEVSAEPGEREPRDARLEHPVFHPGLEPDELVPPEAAELAGHVGELAGATAVLEALEGADAGERYALDYIAQEQEAGKSNTQIAAEMEQLRDSAETAVEQSSSIKTA